MKKKILIISNFYPPNIVGGYEIACRDTVKILSNSFDVSILTSNFKLKSGEYDSNVFPLLKCFKNFGYFQEVFTSKDIEQYNPKIVKEVISNLKPDIVYVWNFNGLGFDFLKIPTEMKIPLLYHFMDESILTYSYTLKRIILKILGKYPEPLRIIQLKGDYGIFISDFLKNKLQFNSQKILKNQVIYPYVNCDEITEKNNYSLNKTVEAIFVGQIEKHKGIDQLCEAIALFNAKSKLKIKLTAFGKSGSGLDKILLEKYSDLLIIQSNSNRDSILKKIHEFDLGFFPSIWDEPFGIAQIELMGAGLPVFTTMKGGSAEAVDINSSMPLNFNDLSTSLEVFLADDIKRASVGKAARERVKREFNSTVYTEKIHGVIRKILKVQ